MSHAAYKFEPVILSVPITLSEIEIGPYPSVVKRIFGRGDWPYHNVVFPFRDLSIYRIIETKLVAAYNSIGAELEICRFLGETPPAHLLAAERAQRRRALVRRYLLDWWYKPGPRRINKL